MSPCMSLSAPGLRRITDLTTIIGSHTHHAAHMPCEAAPL